MLLTLYDSYGNVKARIAPDESSTQDKEIQGDNLLKLSFTLYEFVPIDVNDYVDYGGERYWAVEKYVPAQKSTVEWEYSLQLYGIESLIKRFLVLNNTDGGNEAVFTLTGRPVDHVRLIVKNINDGMDGTTNFKAGAVEGTENVVIDYTGKYCHEALKELAEAVGTEWWFDGETLNLCRCEHGEEVALGYDKGLTSLDRDTADGAKFYTRLFPIGSTRNIDPEKYGHSRLMLPDGARYVDVNVEKYGIIHHYEQSAFAGIYPRRVGVVGSVRYEEVKDKDGKPFTIYYFRDNDLPFDPNDYEIGGLVKRVSFQEGSELAGLGTDNDHYFEVNFNSDTKEFEIITIWPYDDDTQLPGGTLVPKAGDKYILWNIRMPDEYYGLAEKELRSAVDEYNRRHALDVSRYKAPTDHVWIEDTGTELFIGRRIRLESREYFPETGYRQSRITRISRKVNLPGQMDLEISDALSTGAMAKIDDAIAEAKNYAGTMVGSINVPDIIRSWDTTKPADTNLYSARRTHKEFLSKNSEDRARKKIIFDEGLDLGDFEAGTQGGHLDGKGNAELLTLVVRELLRSARFTDGMAGEGWQMWIDKAGLANLTLDKLTVRQVMVVLEMLIERVRSIGGQLVVSAANGKIKSVEKADGYWRITFEQENTFEPHDLMRCATFSGGRQKSYWVEVAAVEGEAVLVSESEFDTSLPEAADECVQMGNTENALRRNLILISATEDGQPRVDVMDGVKEKNFKGCLRARLGNLDGIRDDWFPADNQPHGDGLYATNAFLKGVFVLANGVDVKTQFSVTEGKIQTSVEGLRTDFVEMGNYIANATFANGSSCWQMDDGNVTFYMAGIDWIWATNGPLALVDGTVYSSSYDGRTELHITAGTVRQLSKDLLGIPDIPTDARTGKKKAIPVTLRFYYRCAQAGVLRVFFDNVDKTGFEDFTSIDVTESLAVTDGYRLYTCRGLWNGSGDFALMFSGEIYVYMPMLTSDTGDVIAERYKTLFNQSDTLVKISAQNFNDDGTVSSESSIVTTAKYNELISMRFNADGSLKNSAGLVTSSDLDNALSDVVRRESFAGLFATAVAEDGTLVKRAEISSFVSKDGDGYLESGVKIGADNIDFIGRTTINGNFVVDTDGNVAMKNCSVTGRINATSGYIGGNTVYNGNTGTYENVGGFTIQGNGLTNVVPQSNMKKEDMAYIICRNDYYGRFAGIGANVLPASTGAAAVARFENTDTHSWYGANIAMLLKAANGAYNYAFIGTGNGVLDGDIIGYGYQELICIEGKITETDYSKGSKVFFTNWVTNGGLSVPTRNNVQASIGGTASTKFSVFINYVQKYGSTTANVIYGKNATVYSNVTPSGSGGTYTITNADGSTSTLTVNTDGTIKVVTGGSTTTHPSGTVFKNYWMNKSTYPQLYDNDKNDVDSISMGIGDCLSLLLLYDGSSYSAFMTNKNWTI